MKNARVHSQSLPELPLPNLSVTSEINPVHIISPYCSLLRYVLIICPSTSSPLKLSPSFKFYTRWAKSRYTVYCTPTFGPPCRYLRFCKNFSSLPRVLHAPGIYLHDLITWQCVQVMSVSSCSSLEPPVSPSK